MLAIDIALRPPGSRFAFDSVAVANSIDPVAASAMWQSLGLADPRNSGVTITAWEAEVLTAAVSFVEVLGDEGAAKIARVLGAAAARVGEAVVEALRVGVQLPQLEQGRAYADVIQHFAMLAELTYPTLVQTFDLAVRRHITAFARGEWLASDDHRAMNLDRLIGFVDIVGYTRLSSTLTAGDLAELLSAFHATVGRLVAPAGGRTVKTIGDEVSSSRPTRPPGAPRLSRWSPNSTVCAYAT